MQQETQTYQIESKHGTEKQHDEQVYYFSLINKLY